MKFSVGYLNTPHPLKIPALRSASIYYAMTSMTICFFALSKNISLLLRFCRLVPMACSSRPAYVSVSQSVRLTSARGGTWPVFAEAVLAAGVKRSRQKPKELSGQLSCQSTNSSSPFPEPLTLLNWEGERERGREKKAIKVNIKCLFPFFPRSPSSSEYLLHSNPCLFFRSTGWHYILCTIRSCQ